MSTDNILVLTATIIGSMFLFAFVGSFFGEFGLWLGVVLGVVYAVLHHFKVIK